MADTEMSLFDELIRSGLPLNWTTLLVGWQGTGNLHRQVDIPDLVAFTARRISQAQTSCPIVDELLALSNSECDSAEQILAELALAERGDPLREERKWALIALKRVLHQLPNEPVDALTALTGFWSSFGYPSYSPHQFKELATTLRPQCREA